MCSAGAAICGRYSRNSREYKHQQQQVVYVQPSGYVPLVHPQQQSK